MQIAPIAWAKPWSRTGFDGLQASSLQVDVSELVAHEADEPNAGVDLAQSEALAGEDRRDDDLSAMQTDGAVAGGDKGEVVQGIGQPAQSGKRPG